MSPKRKHILVKLPVACEKALSSKWLLNYRQIENGNEVLPVQCPPECSTGDGGPLGIFGKAEVMSSQGNQLYRGD
jgi:hypothetical protein